MQALVQIAFPQCSIGKLLAALASDESEVASEFEQEGFEVADEGVFEFGLGVFVLEAEEFEDERVFDFLLGRDAVGRARARAFAEHGGFVARKGGAFVEERGHLAIQLAHGPAAAQGLGFVEGARFGRTGAAKQVNVMCPRERENLRPFHESEFPNH